MRMADRHLIDKCLNGDSAAFGMLVDRYKESVYALAYSRLRNFHDAEDVTQEAFTKAYQKLRTLRRWDEFYAWIYAITSNLCKDWIRAKSRRPDREFVADHSPRSLRRLSMESRNEDPILEVLHEALDSLPESYQQVLTLHYLGGMGGVEIAEFLGKSPSAVWQSLSRARESLRKEILDMMSETYEQNRLRAGFTFRIVEMVRRIRIAPVPPRVWPWGFSIATGVIIGILCIGSHLDLTNTESYTSTLSVESMVQEVGEFPVDVIKVSDMPVTSGQQLLGNSLDTVIPGLQNALFMAPQAEGGTWTKKANMPNARHYHFAGVVNGKIYLIGGSFPLAWALSVEEYDSVTGKWTGKANMPTARAGLSVGVVDGKIYAIGGVNNFGPNRGDIFLSAVEEYDPVLDKWTKKTDMSFIRTGLSVGVVGGKIYAIGGADEDHGGLSTVEEYDPISDRWIKKSDMPTGRRGLSVSVVDGKIYVIGGEDDGILPTVEEYDPAIDGWAKRADMPTARTSLSTSVVNGKIYAIGGIFKGMDGRVEEYDPVLDKWTRKTDMPTGRYVFSTSTVNGKIYAIGGNDADNILSTVEEYDPQAESQSIDFKGKLPTTWGEVRTASGK